MRYTLLLHYPEMTAEELGEEMLEQGKAAFHAYAAALDDAAWRIGTDRARKALPPSVARFRKVPENAGVTFGVTRLI